MITKEPGTPSGRQREDTAYHEAGHVVTAYVLGREFILVSITSQGTSSGRCNFAPRPPEFDPWDAAPSTRARIEAEVITDLAGGIAERIATGIENPIGSAADVYFAIDTATFVTSNDNQLHAYVARARERAEAIVREYWPAVQAIAEALLRLDQLDRHQARRIIEGAGRHGVHRQWTPGSHT